MRPKELKREKKIRFLILIIRLKYANQIACPCYIPTRIFIRKIFWWLQITMILRLSFLWIKIIGRYFSVSSRSYSSHKLPSCGKSYHTPSQLHSNPPDTDKSTPKSAQVHWSRRLFTFALQGLAFFFQTDQLSPSRWCYFQLWSGLFFSYTETEEVILSLICLSTWLRCCQSCPCELAPSTGTHWTRAQVPV